MEPSVAFPVASSSIPNTTSVSTSKQEEISTNKEEEILLFIDMASLYRCVSNTEEWCEQGRVDVTIFKHKVNGETRILMRGEQDKNICCNHFIMPHLSLESLPNRTWKWVAQDLSEGKEVQVKFVLQLETMDQARKFKGVFEEARKKSVSVKSQQPSGEAFQLKKGSQDHPRTSNVVSASSSMKRKPSSSLTTRSGMA